MEGVHLVQVLELAGVDLCHLSTSFHISTLCAHKSSGFHIRNRGIKRNIYCKGYFTNIGGEVEF